MINNDKDPVAGRDVKIDTIFFDTKTDAKIHQHLSDKNDEIAEQDIENVATGVDEAGGEAILKSGVSDETGIDNEKEPEEKEAVPIITPWNILGS